MQRKPDQRRITETKLSTEGRGKARDSERVGASTQVGSAAGFHWEEMAISQKQNSVQHYGQLFSPPTAAVCPCLVLAAGHSAQVPRWCLGLDKPQQGVLQQVQYRTCVTWSRRGWSFPTLRFSPSCHSLCFLPPTVSATPRPTSFSSPQGNLPRSSCVSRHYFSCESTELIEEVVEIQTELWSSIK